MPKMKTHYEQVSLKIIKQIVGKRVKQEGGLPIRVLLADDSDVVRTAIVRLLNDKPDVELVAETDSFSNLIQMATDFRPEILLMDLHLPEKRDFTPDFVKSQLARVPTIAISLSNDDEARELAASYGALMLLDKMKLYEELVPAIMKSAPTPFRCQSDAQLVQPLSADIDQT
jgi:DNA-binding NarL/FixJ family response regulator